MVLNLVGIVITSFVQLLSRNYLNPDGRWKLPLERRTPIERAIGKAGARALVARKEPEWCDCPAWLVTGDAGVLIRYLEP